MSCQTRWPQSQELMTEIPLTELAHGGGCGCKLAPGLLAEILAQTPSGVIPPELMVGIENNDDAAVWRLNDSQALVATTDFFTPIVDDPSDFGRIAATNALSDIYAMGGKPIMALAIVGMPIARLSPETIGRILAGGAAVCQAAGIPIAGGHSIDVVEPIYGLVAMGLVHPDQVRRNRDARQGDRLLLGKPLGVGVLSAAFKQRKLSTEGYAAMLQHTTQLNAVGTELAQVAGVHAMTDVTGFGLAGHLLEMCRGADLGATIHLAELPWIDDVVTLARQGVVTGASRRNWASYGNSVQLPADAEPWEQDLLSDPQTSGGLLVSCAPPAVNTVLDCFHQAGFAQACEIGELTAYRPGTPRLTATRTP